MITYSWTCLLFFNPCFKGINKDIDPIPQLNKQFMSFSISHLKWFNGSPTQLSNHPPTAEFVPKPVKTRSTANVISATWSPAHRNKRGCLSADFNNSHSLFISYKSPSVHMTHKNTPKLMKKKQTESLRGSSSTLTHLINHTHKQQLRFEYKW